MDIISYLSNVAKQLHEPQEEVSRFLLGRLVSLPFHATSAILVQMTSAEPVAFVILELDRDDGLRVSRVVVRLVELSPLDLGLLYFRVLNSSATFAMVSTANLSLLRFAEPSDAVLDFDVFEMFQRDTPHICQKTS